MPSTSVSDLFAITAPGLESIALGELKRLGIKGKAEVGGVSFPGDVETVYTTNLWLRTASRIVVRIAHFHASTFHELERRAKQVPWAEFLPASSAVRVRATCRKSRLYHSDAVAQRILDAISRAAPGVMMVEGDAKEADPDHDTPGDDSTEIPAQLFIVRIVDDQCEISADTSGELLHRRGYRLEAGKAPLRETLAAAMLLASGWKAVESLVDPLCGSGTILIEAALLARGIAPGMRRRFAFMEWPNFNAGKWKQALVGAEGASLGVGAPPRIIGADRDAGAIGAAVRNAERAGVERDVRFAVRSLSVSLNELESLAHPGWVLTNPPYGVRVGDPQGLRNLYAKLGSTVKSAPGWKLGILTSDAKLSRQIGLPMRARFSTSNGGIPVAFFAQEKARLGIGKVASISVSSGGVPKQRVIGAQVSVLGLQNDAQNDTAHHGGPDRAVCIYSLENILALKAEGHPIETGSVGENITVEGLTWELVVPGLRLKVGESVVLEVTSFTSPCKTIRRAFIDGRFVRISQKVHPGWSRVYARVIHEGDVGIGDRVEALAAGEHPGQSGV